MQPKREAEDSPRSQSEAEDGSCILRLLTVCHMHPSRFLPRHGIFLIRQAQWLAEHGIDFTFLVPRPNAPWPLHLFPKWKEYGPENPLVVEHPFKIVERRYFRPPGGWFKLHEGKSIASTIRREAHRLHSDDPYDAILACPMLPDATSGRLLKEELDIPLVTLAIGSDVLVYPRTMPSLEPQLRESARASDLAVGVSKDICNRLRELGARDPQCVYLSRDAAQFKPPSDRNELRDELGWRRDDIVAIFVGRLATTKGTTELLQSIRTLIPANPSLRLVLVGDGPEKEAFTGLAQDPTYTHRVNLLGELAPDSVPKYLQAADFLVFPSYSEGMPQAVLEAMNCGLPVVATRVGGVPEAVLDGDNGVIIEPRDTTALTSAMQRLIEDDEFRVRAGQRSLEIVTTKFDPDTNAAKLATALKEVTS